MRAGSVVLGGVLLLATAVAAASEDPAGPLAPMAVTVSADGDRLFVAYEAARRVAVLDAGTGNEIEAIPVPGRPSGLALSPDGERLYVTCAGPASVVSVIDVGSGRELARLRAGHTAQAPVLSPDGRTLYVCNRFDDDVQVFALEGGAARRIPVVRQPVAAALTPDGRLLVVVNLLPAGVSTKKPAAKVTLIETASGRVVKQIKLPNGCGLARGVAISPDGRHAVVTHVLGRYYLPTLEPDFGRVNSNALSLLDLERQARVHTVLLDNVRQGAANPWAVAWSDDGDTIVVSLAGTQELCLIDAPALFRRERHYRVRAPLFLNGPRALALSGSTVFVAGYFSDNLNRVDLTRDIPRGQAFGSLEEREPTGARLGKALFNDARICKQGWQSCASCHAADGRVDALNWDLPNDGIGNPKNTRSLLLAPRTPPAMSHGVRKNAQVAVRAGIEHILFSEQPEYVALAIDEHLAALEAVASPHLVDGQLSAAAQRGRRVFFDSRTGCAGCHPPELFTSLRTHDVGTRTSSDTSRRFDTPTLVELWRTAPYLHDGSAATLREVLTTRNPEDRHGRTSHLGPGEIDDLVAYLLSL